MPGLLQRSNTRCSLRELDPLSVWIKYHGNTCSLSERDRRQALATARSENLGVSFVDIESLKGDVAPDMPLHGLSTGASGCSFKIRRVSPARKAAPSNVGCSSSSRTFV